MRRETEKLDKEYTAAKRPMSRCPRKELRGKEVLDEEERVSVQSREVLSVLESPENVQSQLGAAQSHFGRSAAA